MMKRLWVGISLLLASVVLFSACQEKKDTVQEAKDSVIRVGTSPGPYSELFLSAIQPILEKEGYQIDQVEFTELIQADVALSEGSIDLNVDQHTAYINNFNENKKANLVGITPIPTVPAAIFPGRKSQLSELDEGDKIGIPDDASNTARAFNLLQKAGLIKLKEGIDPIKATKEDVVENSKNLELIQMSSAQLPRSLADLDFAVIPGSVVYSASLDPKDSLLSEDVLKEYELVATVDKKNQSTDWAKAVINAYRSSEFKEYLAKNNEENYWFIPKEIQEE